ncbi:MAG: hypothetical protein ACK5V3_15050 [Bdellovibrionales bacterium]
MMKILSFQFAILFLLFLKSVIGLAHVPVFLDRSTSFTQPFILKPPLDKSIAIYTGFDHADETDVYQFTVNEQDLKTGKIEILIGTLVPSCGPLKDLLISWALTGPQQEAINDQLKSEVLKKVIKENGEGAFLIENETQGKHWYEPYTRHHYFYQKRQKIKLSKPGIYRIFVWSKNSLAGDYVLEFGDKEIWELGDILYTLFVYPKLLFEAEIKTRNCTTSTLQ